MKNKVDNLLEQLHNDVPKINPYLKTKIYSKATNNKKISFPFFKKRLLTALCSIIICLSIITLIISNIDGRKSNVNIDKNHSSFEPTLSGTEQDVFYVNLEYAIYTQNYDVVTLAINNENSDQKFYIKSYNLDFDDIIINNADASIKEVSIENETFFEIVVNNIKTSVHYLDICFKKETIKNILTSNNIFNLSFIVYLSEVDSEKGYGFNFNINSAYDLREGNII